MQKIILKNENNTADLAKNLSKILEIGDVVLLNGDLGSGKTAFTRYLINSITNKKTEVPSPTFTILQNYDTNIGEIYHFDLYRLENENEVIEIGFEEALIYGITIIEWPDRLGKYIPEDRLELSLSINLDQTRTVEIVGFGNWTDKAKEIGLE